MDDARNKTISWQNSLIGGNESAHTYINNAVPSATEYYSDPFLTKQAYSNVPQPTDLYMLRSKQHTDSSTWGDIMPHSPCRLREEAVFDNTRKVELSRELIDLFSSYFQHFHLVHSFMPHDIKSSCKNQYGCLHMMYFCGFCVFFCIIVCRSQRRLRIRLVCIVNHYNLSSRWQRDMYSHVQTKTIHPGLLLLGKTIFHQAWQGRWKNDASSDPPTPKKEAAIKEAPGARTSCASRKSHTTAKVCLRKGKQSETRMRCKTCRVPFHRGNCFILDHTQKKNA